MKVNSDGAQKPSTRGIGSSSRKILETFGVDKINRTKKLDPIETSGNQVLRGGITDSIRLGEDTGKNEIQGSGLVGNNNILDTWTKGYARQPRRIVMDYSKNPGKAAREKARKPAVPSSKVSKNSVDAEV